MKANSNLKVDHFLTILPLQHMKNAEEVDLMEVLDDVFEFAEADEMKIMLKSYCTAALSESYVWKEGPPANLLFCAQLFEQLMEVAWLKKEERPFAHFFELYDLPNWKRILAGLTEAGLGEQSIVNVMAPEESLTFFIEMEALIEASQLVLRQMQNRP